MNPTSDLAGDPTWVPLLLAAFTALATAIGGLVVTGRARWDEARLHYFVALGSGFMLAAVILRMIPVSSEITPHAPLLVLGGYLLIHLVEHTIVRHFHFGEEVHTEHIGLTVGISALVGLSIHSLFDGVSIGSGFSVSPGLGLLIFIAILLHKAPEGFTIASIMLAAGHRRRVALLSSIAVGMASVLGALAVYPLHGFIGEALALSAGVTLYVAASDLIPEVNRGEGKGTAVMVFAGVVLYYGIETALETIGL